MWQHSMQASHCAERSAAIWHFQSGWGSSAVIMRHGHLHTGSVSVTQLPMAIAVVAWSHRLRAVHGYLLGHAAWRRKALSISVAVTAWLSKRRVQLSSLVDNFLWGQGSLRVQYYRLSVATRLDCSLQDMQDNAILLSSPHSYWELCTVRACTGCCCCC